MAFLTRSVTCIVVNKTSCALRLSSSEHLHGSADTPIPEVIPAGGSGRWTSSTAGVFTGTEGRVVFEIEGAEATFEVYWDNPFIGTNAFKQSFKLQPDVGESPAGKYTPSEPSGEDLEDAEDVTVTYKLTIEPHPEVAPGAGAGGATAGEPTPPPPDEDAPQVVEAQPGVENHASGIGVLTAPRLSVALNEVDPGDAGTNTSIDATLELIAKRLEGGLDVVWKKGAAMGLWDPAKWKESDPEEQWARAITELLLGQPYNGAAAPYGFFDKDTIFYEPFTDPSASPLVSLTAACQHNASFGVLSRGFALSDAGGMGFSCDDASSMGMFKAGGKWFRDKEKLDLAKAVDAGLTPGSIYVFKPPPVSALEKKQNLQRKGSHIAFVLRVDRDQKQAQFFDTGGLQHRERVSGPVPAIMMKFASMGSYDDPLWNKVATDHYIGMGIPRPPADLPAAVARIRRTRPIAFARLVLTARGAKFPSPIDPKSPPSDLLFVSRLLRTWGDAEDQNFTIARYFWSLRSLPCTREVQALWFFYVPRNVYSEPKATPEQKAKARTASAVLAAPRATKIDDLGVPLHRQCYLVIGSLADGKAIQVQRRATHAEGNEQGSTTRARSYEKIEPGDGVPGNLHNLLDGLPPSEMVAPSNPALPLLFKDYVDLTA